MNVDQELQPNKRPNKERRGWQGEENNIENVEQELKLGRFFGFCSVFSLRLADLSSLCSGFSPGDQAIIVHSSSPDSVRMPGFFATSKSTVFNN